MGRKGRGLESSDLRQAALLPKSVTSTCTRNRRLYHTVGRFGIQAHPSGIWDSANSQSSGLELNSGSVDRMRMVVENGGTSRCRSSTVYVVVFPPHLTSRVLKRSPSHPCPAGGATARFSNILPLEDVYLATRASR